MARTMIIGWRIWETRNKLLFQRFFVGSNIINAFIQKHLLEEVFASKESGGKAIVEA